MKRPILIGLVVALMLTLIPYGASAQKAEGSNCVAIHVVKKGQTLAVIARKYDTTVAKIANANNIKNKNKIYVGQRLCIPGTPPSKPTQPPHHPPHQPPYYPPEQQPGYYPPPPRPGDPSQSCSMAPVLGFGRIWYGYPNVRAHLRCPVSTEQGFKATTEPFYSGYVIQDNANKQIYVLFSNGYWEVHPDTWKQGDPIDNPWLQPPAGYYQPQYGIGKMWRNNDNLSQRLGWAKLPQADHNNASMQDYEGGKMIWIPNVGIYVLYNNASWQRYY